MKSLLLAALVVAGLAQSGGARAQSSFDRTWSGNHALTIPRGRVELGLFQSSHYGLTDRVELSLHSIHYLDLIRQVLGDPKGVHAKSLGHPAHGVAQTRTSAILDYGDRVRCNVSINHDHKFGRKHQASEFLICGTEGAAWLQLGERPSAAEGAGMLLILSGLALLTSVQRNVQP